MDNVTENVVPNGKYIAHGMYCRISTNPRSGESRIFFLDGMGFLITQAKVLTGAWEVKYVIPNTGEQDAVLVPRPN